MDIKGEVPQELQGVVSAAYLSYLGLCLCLLYQLASVIVAVALINTKSGRLSGFFLALIYTLIGIPGAWMIWCHLATPLAALGLSEVFLSLAGFPFSLNRL